MAGFSIEAVKDGLKGKGKWYIIGGVGALFLIILFVRRSSGGSSSSGVGVSYQDGYGGSVGGGGSSTSAPVDLSGISADFTNQVTQLSNSFTDAMNQQNQQFSNTLATQGAQYTAQLTGLTTQLDNQSKQFGNQLESFNNQMLTMQEQSQKNNADFALALGSMQQSTSQQFSEMSRQYSEQFASLNNTNQALSTQLGDITQQFTNSLFGIQDSFNKQMDSVKNTNSALEQKLAEQSALYLAAQQALRTQPVGGGNHTTPITSPSYSNQPVVGAYSDTPSFTNWAAATTPTPSAGAGTIDGDKLGQVYQEQKDKYGTVGNTGVIAAPPGWVDPGWKRP